MRAARRLSLLLIAVLPAVVGTAGLAAGAAPPPLTVSYPAAVVNGADPVPYESTFTNSTSGTCTPSWTVTAHATRGSFDAGDLSLSVNGTTLGGRAGASTFSFTTPGVGSVPAGMTAHDSWTIGYAPTAPSLTGISITTTESCDTLSGTVTGSVAVTPAPSIALRMPATVVKGVTTPVTATIDNTTPAAITGMHVDIAGCERTDHTVDGCRTGTSAPFPTVRIQDPSTHQYVRSTCQFGQAFVFDCGGRVVFSVPARTTLTLHLTVSVPAGSTGYRLELYASAISTTGVDLNGQAAAALVAAPGAGTPPSAQPRTTPTLPVTGAPTVPATAGTGAFLLLVGVLVSWLSRRRRAR